MLSSDRQAIARKLIIRARVRRPNKISPKTPPSLRPASANEAFPSLLFLREQGYGRCRRATTMSPGTGVPASVRVETPPIESGARPAECRVRST